MHLVLKFYSISRMLYEKKVPILPNVIYKFMRVFFSCDLKYTVKIGSNVKFYHNALGVVIHKQSIIGNNVSIYQNVTLGGNGKIDKLNGPPIIKDGASIGAGAVILGPVIVGENAKVGANAVVTSNVPPGATAVGVPARVKEI